MQLENELSLFLNESDFGYLTFMSADGPDTTPLNFAYLDGAIWFHGSLSGNRAESLKQNGTAHFSVASQLGYIPSYFSDPHRACPASAYFKSAILYGSVEAVTTIPEKIQGLSALMQKLQPEGGYAPFDAADVDYSAALNKVGVYRLKVTNSHYKVKLGQQLNQARWDRVIAALEQRDAPGDQALIIEMKNQKLFRPT